MQLFVAVWLLCLLAVLLTVAPLKAELKPELSFLIFHILLDNVIFGF